MGKEGSYRTYDYGIRYNRAPTWFGEHERDACASAVKSKREPSNLPERFFRAGRFYTAWMVNRF